MVVSGRNVKCIYGTVTGKSQSIAEQIVNEFLTKDIQVDLYSFEEFNKSWNLDDLDILIIVSSTTGDGEQPEAITKFWRKLRPKTLPGNYLSYLNFTILGLGDTNYNQFCNAPKNLRRRLKELGGVEIYPPGWADDGTGLEIVVEPWLETLFPTISKFVKGEEINKLDNTPETVNIVNTNISKVEVMNSTNIETKLDHLSLEDSAAPNLRYSSKLASLELTLPNLPSRFIDVQISDVDWSPTESTPHQNNSKLPFAAVTNDGDAITSKARVISNVKLSSPDAVKTYMEMVLDTGKCLGYQPGDSFGVICQNDDEDVKYLAKRLNLDSVMDKLCSIAISPNTTKPKAKVPDFIAGSCSVGWLLRTCLDLRTVPKKLFLRSLVEVTTVPEERRRIQELCSKQGSLEYMSVICEPRLCLLDLLKTFASCSPSLSLLVEHLPRLLPRPYSMSSSPLESPNQLKFIYTLVQTPRPGLCTSYLSKCKSGDSVEIYLRSGTEFRLPEATDTHFLMVCAGSGIGPFLGFLEHRKQLGVKTGFTWLVFGCRQRGKDDLHSDKLLKYVEDGYLSKLSIAYSREQSEDGVTYVQDMINKDRSEVEHLLVKDEGTVFVCGDAKNMGKSVFQTFTKVVTTEERDGAQFMKQMITENRYKQDLWT